MELLGASLGLRQGFGSSTRQNCGAGGKQPYAGRLRSGRQQACSWAPEKEMPSNIPACRRPVECGSWAGRAVQAELLTPHAGQPKDTASFAPSPSLHPSPPQTRPLHHGQPDPSHISPPGGQPSLAGPPGAAQSSARLPCLPAGTGVGKKHRTGPEADSFGHRGQTPSHSVVPIRYLTYPWHPCPSPRCCQDAPAGESRVCYQWQMPGGQRPPCQPHWCQGPPREAPNSPDMHVPSPCSCRGRAANLCVL